MAVKSDFVKLDSRMGDIAIAFNDIKIKGRQLQTSLETNANITKYGAAYIMKPLLDDYRVICSKLYNNALTTLSGHIDSLIALNDVFYKQGIDLGDDIDWSTYTNMTNGYSLIELLTRIHSFRTAANTGECLLCSPETANKLHAIMESVGTLDDDSNFLLAAAKLKAATYNYSTLGVVSSTSYRDEMTAAIADFTAVNPVCTSSINKILTYVMEASFFPSSSDSTTNILLTQAIDECIAMLKSYFSDLPSTIFVNVEPLIDACTDASKVPALRLSFMLKSEGLEAMAVAAKDELLAIIETLTEEDIDQGLITRNEAKTAALEFLKIMLNLADMITAVIVADVVANYPSTFNLQQICLEDAQPYFIEFYEIEYPVLADYTDENPWLTAYLLYLGSVSAESKDLLGFDRAIFIASGLVEEIYRLIVKSGSSINEEDAKNEVKLLTTDIYYPTVAILNKLKKYHEEGTGYIYQELGNYEPFIKIPDSISQPYIYDLSTEYKSTTPFQVEVDMGNPKSALVGFAIYDSDGNKVADIGTIGGKGNILYLDKSELNKLKGTNASGVDATYSLVATFKDSTVTAKDAFVFTVTGAIPDTTPPVFLTAPTFNTDSSTDTMARIDFKTDEPCSLYYILVKVDDPTALPPEPQPLDVIAGINGDGSTDGIVDASSVSYTNGDLTANRESYVLFNNLERVTSYVAYFVAVDPYMQNQKTVTKVEFMTLDDIYSPELISLTVANTDTTPDTVLLYKYEFDEDADVYAMLMSVDATPPETWENIRDGVDKNNVPDNVINKQTAKAYKDTELTLQFTGLTQNTSYMVYIAAVDANGNASQVYSQAGATNEDKTPPVLSRFEVASAGLTSLKAEVSINEDGKIYYMILPVDGATNVSVDDIILAGSTFDLTTDQIALLEFNDLIPNTPYAFWYATEDKATPISNLSTKAEYKTNSASTLFMTKDYGKITDIQGFGDAPLTPTEAHFNVTTNVTKPSEFKAFVITTSDYINVLKSSVSIENIISEQFIEAGNSATLIETVKLTNSADIKKNTPFLLDLSGLLGDMDYTLIMATTDENGVWPVDSSYITVYNFKTPSASTTSE